MGFPEAVEQLAGEVGMEVPREAGSEDDARASVRTAILAKLSEADQFYRKQLRSSTKAIEYLKNRGLSGEIARDFGVGVAPEGWDNLINEIGKSTEDLSFLEQSGLVIKNEDRDSHYDRFRDRIIFPIRDTRGRTIAFGGRVLDDSKPKYLNSPESPVFHKSRELYGLYECLQRKARFEEIFVVEGYMDVIALAQQGINNGVATLGTACGPAHLEKLFRHVGRIIFCFDGDEAGARAAERALHAALPLMIDGRQVKFLFLPSGEDPDTIVRDEGKTGFEARLKDAMPLSNYIMELAGAGSKLTDAESKSRAHAQVMPLINQLPRGAFRTLMEQEVLDRIGVAVTVEPAISVEQAAPLSPVNEESEETDEASAPQKFAKRARSKTSTSLSAHLISLLLQYPKLISLAEELASLQAEDEDEQLFLDLCAYLHNKPETTLSNLLGYWMAAEPEQAKRLTELASARLIDIQSGEIAADAVAKDFTDTLSRWTSQQQGGRLRERIKVLGRIPLDQQSSEQKAEMRDLMEKLRALN